MPLIVLICVYGIFYESKLLGIDNFSDSMCLGDIHGSLEGKKLKIGEENAEIPSNRL